MEVITTQPRVALHLEPPPSQRRHLRQAAVLAVAVALIALVVARYNRRQDAAHLHELLQFSSAYATDCDAPELNAPLPPAVRGAYLRSPALQEVVARQTAELASGASCDDVTQALRNADFPAPLPARPPTIHLQPGR